MNDGEIVYHGSQGYMLASCRSRGVVRTVKRSFCWVPTECLRPSSFGCGGSRNASAILETILSLVETDMNT